MVFRLGDEGVDRVVRRAARARYKQRRSAADDVSGDGGNLLRRLSQAKNHLWKPLPDAAMVVDACEPEVLERLSPECLDQLLQCVCRIGVAPGDAIEQILEQFV